MTSPAPSISASGEQTARPDSCCSAGTPTTASAARGTFSGCITAIARPRPPSTRDATPQDGTDGPSWWCWRATAPLGGSAGSAERLGAVRRKESASGGGPGRSSAALRRPPRRTHSTPHRAGVGPQGGRAGRLDGCQRMAGRALPVEDYASQTRRLAVLDQAAPRSLGVTWRRLPTCRRLGIGRTTPATPRRALPGSTKAATGRCAATTTRARRASRLRPAAGRPRPVSAEGTLLEGTRVSPKSPSFTDPRRHMPTRWKEDESPRHRR